VITTTQALCVEHSHLPGMVPDRRYLIERTFRDGQEVQTTVRDDAGRAVPTPKARQLIAGADAQGLLEPQEA
jgi:hypothetical protein